MCPTPGALPFRLQSYSFADERRQQDSQMTEPRNKDEASDTLGVSGGVQANIFIADADAPAAGASTIAASRRAPPPTRASSPIRSPTRTVSLWSYDGGAWKALGRISTDGNGGYDSHAATGFTAASASRSTRCSKATAAAPRTTTTCSRAGTKFVVFDIDGTLTTSDDELLMQVTDGTYTPAMMTAANTMVQAWAHKGYTIVYLTARAHIFRAETRGGSSSSASPTARHHHQRHERRAGLQDAVAASG